MGLRVAEGTVGRAGGPAAGQVVVFGAACAGLWWAGHAAWAGALLVFSVLINALAQLPSVRALVADQA